MMSFKAMESAGEKKSREAENYSIRRTAAALPAAAATARRAC